MASNQESLVAESSGFFFYHVRRRKKCPFRVNFPAFNSTGQANA
nr:MAG TPA: hypothetical protein [Caudoviricetes sp.]